MEVAKWVVVLAALALVLDAGCSAGRTATDARGPDGSSETDGLVSVRRR
jgi:hypothetical protein